MFKNVKLLLVFFVFSLPSMATTVSDGEYFENLEFYGTEVVDVLGGTVDNLTLYEQSIANVVDTEGDYLSDGAIWELNAFDNSRINLLGGNIYEMNLYGNSITDVIGGRVTLLNVSENAELYLSAGLYRGTVLDLKDDTAQIHMYCTDYNFIQIFPTFSLSGTWYNGNRFYIGVDNYTYNNINFYIVEGNDIPEPFTVSFLVLGIITILNRKK